MLTAGDNNWGHTLRLAAQMMCWLYLKKRIGSGDIDVLDRSFTLLKDAVDKGYFLVNGRAAGSRFMNTVNVACVNKKTEWAKRFIDKYQKYLPEETRRNRVLLSKAYVNTAEKNWDKALDNLNLVEKALLVNRWSARFMIIKVYYEMYAEENDYSFLESQLNNFREFLQRNKEGLSEPNYKGGLGFVKMLNLFLSDMNGNELLNAYWL